MNILNAYMRDFIKHPETREYPKITMIWDSLPSQLSRKNKKFLYNVVKKGARAREYEDALQWLVPQLDVMPRYWSRTNPPYEVDSSSSARTTSFPSRSRRKRTSRAPA